MVATESILQPPAEQAGPTRWKLWLSAVFGLVVVVFFVRWAAGGTKAAPPVRAVPVNTAAARVGDMPVNLTGLGTVVPTDAVTVHTRVDGQIDKVFFREGQLVREGELLIQIDPRPYQVQLLQAEGQMAKDEAALKNARMDLARYKSLFDQKIIPAQQLDTQGALVDQAAAAVKVDQGAVEAAKLNLTYSRITAPVAGKVGLRLVDPGNVVHASDTAGLVVLTPVSPIDVVFTVPADSIQAVMGSSKLLAPPVAVFDRDLAHQLAMGTLLAVDNQVDTTTGTVRLKARFTNTDGNLFPNQFVNARLLVNTLHDALMVPSAAVQKSPKGSYVYVVKADSTVDLRGVEVLLTDGDISALKGGVANGEKVVINGVDKLRPGSKVMDSAPAGSQVVAK